ncbi:hypothetical protein H6P81_015133 [Aristolochia fimbriata]|uniref:Uncharacterized protein n=1 Tax=Aristolochia fimbriata TaxID=158543 RepID=A0AAV7E964_ARIFI|nr:hypothetical protein H6P81_015133 [Aristolochia fimbriata]
MSSTSCRSGIFPAEISLDGHILAVVADLRGIIVKPSLGLRMLSQRAGMFVLSQINFPFYPPNPWDATKSSSTLPLMVKAFPQAELRVSVEGRRKCKGSEMKRITSILPILLLALRNAGFAELQDSAVPLSSDDFPPYFAFGAGTSAYQVEGAVAEDGRSPSIWDVATHSGRMVIAGNGDVTADQYHKFKEDVELMSDIGLDAYRMSISWSRLLPNGRGAINPKGLEYYNNLINELTEHGIEPHVTLYHLDHPQVLEDEYGGWLSPKMVEDFTGFADICFREFGDRVFHWTTINEPNVFGTGAYDNGFLPPQRCSEPFGLTKCDAGNSTVEPYIVVHHTLLAHASVATLYKEKYQAKQHGWIGLNVYAVWFSPLSNSTADALAAQRAMKFYNGWILDPIVFGDYPEVMKKNVGPRLPSFTEVQSKQIKGSFDFIGLNHYLAGYAEDISDEPKPELRDFGMDMSCKLAFGIDPTASGQFVPGASLPTTPWALQNLLENIQRSYENPPIYIEENGYGQLYNETLNDTARADYIAAYLNATLNAIRNGSNARGYILWSFLDVFEFLSGYQSRYGLYHVDFGDENRKRTPKETKIHLLQVEGAVAEDGRSPSIWDVATHSGRMKTDGNGDVAADQYHKFKEDVELMSDMGLDAYRMSISWSRLLPNGRGAINPKGLEYYNNLINELIDHGIEPHVTLYHLDHPQVLEDEYGGWLSPKMVEDFTGFADICFREFGDKVFYWTTLNEPNIFALEAYDNGLLPPLRCSEPFGLTECDAGNSTVEPYIVVHHTLLAHASVATLYKEKYQAKQHGWIGLNLYGIWVSPLGNSTADALAAQRAMKFFNGWILDPIVFGDYPEVMKKNVGPRLPTFTEVQSKQIKGSFDFVGLNHYHTGYAQDISDEPKPELRNFGLDMFCNLTFGTDKTSSGQVRWKHFNKQFAPGASSPTTPWALQNLLENIHRSYGNPPIYIEENGYGQLYNETLNDSARADYIAAYLNATRNAIRNGSNAKGYFVWSFVDVYELISSYLSRYGLYHVDFGDKNRTRTPKYSAHWFTNFLDGKKKKKQKKKATIRKPKMEIVSVDFYF